MGALILLRSLIFPPEIDILIALTVGFALSLVIIVATLVGAVAPLIINKIGLDPAVIASPVMATIIDLSGLTIYFLIAKLILQLK